MVETQREVSAYALPLPSAVYRKFPTFPQATALQHCLNHLITPLGAAVAGRPPYRCGPRQVRPLPLRVTVAGRCPTYDRFTVLWLFLSHFSSAV